MKLRKIFGVLIILLSLILVFGIQSVQAANAKYTLGITNVRESADGKSGGAYAIPVNTGNSTFKKIWKIVSYDNNKVINYDNAFYCLKAELGFTSNSTTDVSSIRKNYDVSYNMKTQKNDVMSHLNAINVFKTNQTSYNKLMWLLDNIYLPKQQTEKERDKLLLAAKIIGPEGYADGLLLTDDDIEVVQQMAIWYFTNSDNSIYNNNKLPVLYFNNWSGVDGGYQNFEDLYNDKQENTKLGLKRQYEAEDLYKYLITEANKNGSYVSNDSTAPLELVTKDADVTAVENGANYKIGPYRINKKTNLPYTVNELVFKDESGKKVEANLQNKNGASIKGITLGEDFYIILPITTQIKKLTLNIDISYTTTEATYYTTTESTYKNEQPVVLVEKENKKYKAQVEVQIPERKEFDLSLRKSITKLDGKNTSDRLPQVDVSPLKEGKTTATYNHAKDTLPVETDQEIEYTFTIYNEGEKNGYALEIKDYLPDGIEYESLVSDASKYEVTETKNGDGTTTLTIKNIGKNILNKYNGGDSLSSEQIIIRCRVTKPAEKQNIRLVNVAEITKYYDDELKQEVNKDRDSQKENFPKGQSFNNSYTGKAKQGNYVLGQEDDDDFEAVVLLGKEFDLSLRKSITKINGNDTTGRIPQVDVSPLKEGKTTATYNHAKDTLPVETNQEIEYTFTIYNEGQKNGYASEIKDYLPEGIEYVSLVSDESKYKVDKTKDDNGITTLTITNINPTVLKKYSNGDTLDSDQIKIKCKVTKPVEKQNVRLVNVAEITKYFDSELNEEVTEDRDSQRENFPKELFNNNYQGKETQGQYVLGQEDDDDFEAVVLLGKEFDLSLRKSITKINGNDTIGRIPEVDLSPLKNGSDTTAIYNHAKNSLEVETNQEIEYTFTIYNEGQKNGYASEIKDYLPEGIEYVSLVSDENKYSVSETKNSNGTTTLTITNIGKTVLNKYSNGDTLDSEKITIKCKVTKPAEKQDIRLVNIAEITKYFDSELGGEVTQDRDSLRENFPKSLFNNNYQGKQTQGQYVLGQQDDDDFEAVVLLGKELDLSLRKSITKINGEETTGRIPEVDVSPLKDGSDTTAIYNHDKNSLQVDTNQEIEYTFTIYNEGQKNGYALEIKDYLPAGIEYVGLVSDSNKYKVTETKNSDGTTTLTITNIGKTVLNKYSNGDTLNSDQITINGDTLDSDQITIKCKVVKEATIQDIRLVNVAEITKYFDSELGKEVAEDRDSQKENFPKNLFNNNYQGKETQGEYILGQQDDDDFEAVILKGKEFDLSLRKFITQRNGKDVPTSRIPKVNVAPLKNGETTATYEHTKVPVSVTVGDIITYTIRVYNEGSLAGYVSEITDHLPPQLEFLPDDETNIANGWVYDENDLSLRTIKTQHLSKEVDEDNIIEAFDGTTLDYKDVIVKCKVKSNVISNEKITNIAEITGFTNKAGEQIIDRDSTENSLTQDNSKEQDKIQNDNLPTDEELPNYKDDELNKAYIPGQQDDDDFEKLKVQIFDLALRKFITRVDNTQVTSRIPQLSMSENGNIKYTHTKEPVEVQTNNVVTYTLRIFNEGDIAGYATEITDNLPEGLEFLPEHETNVKYRWVMIDKKGEKTDDLSKAVKVTTDYLSKEQEQTDGANLIKAFDRETGITADNPDYRDVQIAFKVIEPNTSDRILINTAEISNDSDEEGNPVEDIDSTPGNNKDNEDDIDIEKLKLVYFDLALRKFITKVDDTQITSRIPILTMGEDKNIKYNHTKEPVEVRTNNIVTYTLRIFNEGTIAGYASEITDDLPEGLEFLPEHETNVKYRWVMIDENGEKTDDVSKAVKITTDYLSKEQEQTDGANLIKAFDKEVGITADNPDYRDVQIAFKVTEPNTSDRILINTAEISDDSDKEGKPVDDIDSTPNNNEENEDDLDIEKVKVQYFDLSLKKWVSQAIVIENGKENVSNTGHTGDENPEPVVKVEIKSKSVNTVTVKFRYQIKITNEGEIEGYAKEITDYIPEGLKFVKEDNPQWYQLSEDVIATKQLENTLLQPGESASVEVLLTWINNKDNMGLKVNVAEISKDYNESNTPDIDSTPNNQKPGEDDIDDAPVILSTKTGEARIYFGLTTIILVTLAGGIVLIKKFVL